MHRPDAAARPQAPATSQHARDVVQHYTARHAFRQDLFGQQPFANYGYWPHDELSFERAGEHLTDLVARCAGIADGDRVLDVGCGYGANAVCYVRRYKPAQVIGIDITAVRIDNGRDYIAAQQLEHLIQLQLGDATRMDFADASFERLLAVECAFHFDTRRDFLREAARVLASGGTLALTDIIPRRGVDPRAYMNGYRASASGVCLDIPANAYDADIYAGHLRAAGFTDIRIESILEATRLPFARALRRMAAVSAADRAQALLRVAGRIENCSAAGEDYVLVFARKR